MKSFLPIFFLLLLFPLTSFACEHPYTSPAAPLAVEEQDELEKAISSFFPISLEAGYYSVGKATFRSEEFEKHHLFFTQAEASFGFTCPLSINWGLIFGAGWVGNEVRMTENPEFHQTHFGYTTFSIGTFTRIYPKWIWSAYFELSIDNERLDLGNYALYDNVLWGKYTPSEYLDFTFGMIIEIGLNKTQSWPIIGFGYAPFDCLRMSFVYPTDISIDLEITPSLTASGAVRFLRSRHRVGAEEPNPMAIFEYRTAGLEFDLTYAPLDWFWINGFAGKTGKGDFKVTNSNNKHGTHFKFNGSFYAGGSAEIKF